MKKQLNKVLLHDEKEYELVEWAKINPILYDKGLIGYRNKLKKMPSGVVSQRKLA